MTASLDHCSNSSRSVPQQHVVRPVADAAAGWRRMFCAARQRPWFGRQNI